MSNSVIYGFLDEISKKKYGSAQNVEEINETNRVLIQEKEQVKNELICKEYEKLFAEYLGRDPSEWPSAEEVDAQLKSSKEERRRVKEEYEDEKEKISEVVKVVVEEFSALQSSLDILKEKLNQLEEKKSEFQSKRHIDPETVDVAIEKCQKCIRKVEAETEEKKLVLQSLESTITRLKSQATSTRQHRTGSHTGHKTGSQTADRAQKILTFLETASGIVVHSTDQNNIQVKFSKENDSLNLILTLTLKTSSHGNSVLTGVKSNVNGFNIDDIIDVAIATNDVPYLVRQTQERWQQHFPVLSEMDLLIKQHAVDWIQEENKLRVLSKCGKIMFTLNIPKDYPNSRDITLDNACGLDDISDADLPKPPAGLLQWVKYLEEKYEDS